MILNQSSHHRTLAIQPGVNNPKAVEMHVNAGHFVRDGQALGIRASAGQYFLLVHGIELSLKSFLHDKGETVEALWGHDLKGLLQKATANGLASSEPDTSVIIARLSKSVEKAKLRYDYDFEMPLLTDVLRVAHGVLKDTEPVLPPLK
jgi:hypothetical protein